MLDFGTTTHAELMDRTYRHQRLFYDLTRKYYLLGRDRLIAELDAKPGAHVLEIACGTGRNLQLAIRRYPDTAFYGLDISAEMLTTARDTLGQSANLAQADACTFDGMHLFRRAKFDRIFISYGISMIPDWHGALETAAAHLAPGGELHVVDFHDQNGLPGWFKTALYRWLDRFHVTPRTGLQTALGQIAAGTGATTRFRPLYRGYAQHAVLRAAGGHANPS
ncbi:class I SAM-dependent methyltransferase [Microbulbifer sp. S227A]|uniref:class I SAM-dependent methyltransferase n=1 Tax=Microbulbifer sp. S227A TaxID=3415131 RepID=UPI003C7C2A3C